MEQIKKRLATIWITAAIVSGVLLFVSFGLTNRNENFVWLTLLSLLISGVSSLIGCFYLSKAKGYSGVLGILLGMLSIAGLMILIALPDKVKASLNDDI